MSPPAASAQTALGSLVAVPDTGAVPRHVAIIMDGNGRWAKRRLLPRFAGHKAGVDAVRRIARAARAMGIEALTLYAFSSENWRRPETEISDLMGLLRIFLRKDLAELVTDNVRLRVIGDYRRFPADLVAAIDDAQIKEALRRDVDAAIAAGVFGSPFIFVDGEPFWGLDRFEQIERWLASGGF